MSYRRKCSLCEIFKYHFPGDPRHSPELATPDLFFIRNPIPTAIGSNASKASRKNTNHKEEQPALKN
jgi:hypothetical protein